MMALPLPMIAVGCAVVLAACGVFDLLGDSAAAIRHGLHSRWDDIQAHFVSVYDPPLHPAPPTEDTPFDPDFHCGPSHMPGMIRAMLPGPAPEQAQDQVQGQTAQRLGAGASSLDLKLGDGGEVTVQVPHQACSGGRMATVTQVVSPELNAIALDGQSQLHVDLSSQQTSVFRMDFPPTAPMPVTVVDKDANRKLTDTQFIGAVVVSGQDDADDTDDNHASVDPLPSESDASGRVSVTLPPDAFHRTAAGDYQSAVKIAIFDAAQLPCHERVGKDHRHQCAWLDWQQTDPQAARNALIAAAFFIPELNCPLSDGKGVRTRCIETSRFNPNRSFGSAGSHHFHKGMDISADRLPVFLPAGGTPVDGYSPQQYSDDFKTCIDKGGSPTHCGTVAGGGRGITLEMDYGDYSLTVMHLNDIDPRFLTPDRRRILHLPQYNADGTPNARALHSVRTQSVGTSGGTGAGYQAHHLHFEVYANGAGPAFCRTGGTRRTCALLRGPVDPFPYVASRALYKPQAAAGAYAFSLTATDYEGVTVGSSVGHAAENGYRPVPLGAEYDKKPYDPTRKICVGSTGDGVAFSAPDTPSTEGTGHTLCAPWGARIVGRRVPGAIPRNIEIGYSHDPSVAVADDPQVHLVAMQRPAGH